MKILGKSVYRGPHLYSHTPMIRIEIDLKHLENWPTNKIESFNERLLSQLPGLHQHGCSYNSPGGLTKRMEEGTWLGHIIEHVALELQSQAGTAVTRGKTRSIKGKPGVYNIMFEYELENMALCAGRFAIELVNALLPQEIAGIAGLDKIYKTDIEVPLISDKITHLKYLLRKERLGPTTRAIADAAKHRGIPVIRLDDDSLIQLGWGKERRCIRGSITDRTTSIAVDTASDKALTKQLLENAGIPVAPGSVVYDAEGAVKAARNIGYPVVIKPLDGNQGKGVTTNITSDVEAREAFELATLHSKTVIVEQYFKGRDYRVLVVGGQVVAASERIPAHVTGDGIHTIAQLIDLLNVDPLRGDGHGDALTKVVVNPTIENKLKSKGYQLMSIPAAGEKIFLCGTANLSTGGTAIDRTDDIHPANVILMQRAARAIGLDIAGIDLISSDISRPIKEGEGGVLEVNASPGFRMHIHPSEGIPRDVGDAVVSMLFPKEKRSRIPIAAITGTNGKSTTARMVAHILRQKGHRVGLTSTSGIYIDDEMIWEGDASGPQSTRILLSDPSIDFAVFETARGGILREGLAFDSCDVGAVLNIADDHLGIGGVETLEDLAAVKSVVTESVCSYGVSVLNADDFLTRQMAKNAQGNICFFSMSGGHFMSEYLRAHIHKGGMAVVRESWLGDDQIIFHQDGCRIPLLGVNQVPATLRGIADFNIQNALAAAAISLGLGIDISTVRSGLTSFASSYEQNPGRMNIFDDHGFRVIFDYAHNPAALNAILQTVRQMRDNYRSVIGTVSTPGDRSDAHIREMGRIAAGGFDFLVFREDDNTRGRHPGEILRLLEEGARKAGFPVANMICAASETEAIDICLRKATPGDLVVLMPAEVSVAWQQMVSFKPLISPFYPTQKRQINYA
jgi:cyanophycin synthetase